jgi:hypothetical protein
MSLPWGFRLLFYVLEATVTGMAGKIKRRGERRRAATKRPEKAALEGCRDGAGRRRHTYQDHVA